MSDHNTINFYDTDAEDPYHEIKGWLQSNGFRKTDNNIDLFTEKGNIIKKTLDKIVLTWDDFNDQVSCENFER